MEAGKHSTSTETMFFEKVGFLMKPDAAPSFNHLIYCSSDVKNLFNKKMFSGEEGSAELRGVRQLPALSSHFQPGSDLSRRAGPVGHPVPRVSLKDAGAPPHIRSHQRSNASVNAVAPSRVILMEKY